MKLFNRGNEEIDIKNVNEVVSLSKKILHLLYIAMIIAIVFIATLIIREWGILKFILNLLSVLSPVFIGFVIAWLLNPLVQMLQRKKLSRSFGSIVCYSVFILLLIIFLRFLVPTIYTQMQVLIKNMPSILSSIEESFTNILYKINTAVNIDVNAIKTNVFDTIGGYFNNLVNNAPSTFMNFMSVIVSSVVTISFGLVIGLYMLISFDSINHHLLCLIPRKNRLEASVLITNISKEVRKSVNGTFLVATMVFVCDSIGYLICGLQAPILFGLLCGITDLIPYVGPYIGGAVAVIVGFAQSPITGIFVLIVTVLVQLVENNILQPVVMSKTMQLHPVTIIIGLLIFQHFFGILGMILCTPTIALLKVVWQFFRDKYDLFNKDVVEDIPNEIDTNSR